MPVQTVAQISIDHTPAAIYQGTEGQMTATLLDDKGAVVKGKTVNYTSSAPDVLNVTATGQLTGIKVGTAVITGVVDGKSATQSIPVLANAISQVVISPAATNLPRGANYQLSVVLRTANGAIVSGHPTVFTSSNPSVLTVSSTGLVQGVGNGSAVITATVDGEFNASATVDVSEPRTINGIVASTDGSVPANLAFSARYGSAPANVVTLSASVNPVSGAFSLQVPTFASAPPTVEYFVDITPGATRTHHPSRLALSGASFPNGSRILLVQHQVVIDSGTYAGTARTVSLNEAFTPVCTDTSNANCQSYWPSYWINGIKNWSDAARPVPLAFDRTTGAVSAQDSINMWAVIRTMEADLGRSLYKPANFTAYTTTGYTTGMILASFDPSLTGFSGYTNWSWDGTGTLYQAKVRMANPSYFSSPGTVSHEFTHALGFSHTCRWGTVMGGYGCSSVTRYSMDDVAYYHLAERIRKRVAAFSPNWSISEGLAGERQLELGQAPSLALSPVVALLMARPGLPGADAAP